MHIAIDGRTISRTRTGVGVYAERIVRSLLALDRENTYTLFLLEDDPSLEQSNLHKILISRYSGIGPNRFWENFVLPGFLKSNNVDIYFSPAYVLPLIARSRAQSRGSRRTKFVVTIHDLVAFVYPETFTLKMRMWQRLFVGNAVRVADRLLADSESTKEDILRFYSLNPELIRVVHLPVGEQFKPISDQAVLAATREKYHLPDKFILYVGTLEPRKNVSKLAQAYAKLPPDLLNEYSLVLAGASGWYSKDIIDDIKSLNMPDRIRRIGYIDQQNLPALYNLASVFAYLSLYEGFGAPPLEAMACGIPTMCSNSSSLPEAVGDAALLVDAQNVEKISSSLERLLRDDSLRMRLSTAGLTHVQKFTALDKAREVKAIFEELVSADESTERTPS